MVLVKKILKLGLLVSIFAFLVFIPSAFAETHVSGVIDTNTIWTSVNSPYIVDGDIDVASSATLTIEPGVIVKFSPYTRITLDQDGVIHAMGTSANKIYFTSLADDTIGGDTNGDGSLTIPDPETGEHFWGGIYSFLENSSMTFNNVVIRYAEQGLSIRGTRDVQIIGSVFEKNFTGIQDQGKNSVNISNSEIKNNNSGISISQIHSEPNSTYSVNGLSIHGNNYPGVSYFIIPPLARNDSNPFIWFANLFKTKKATAQTAYTVDFRNTWWGDASGPNGPDNPIGLGDVIDDSGFLSPKVLFDPWATVDPFIVAPPLHNPVLIVPGVLGTDINKGTEKLWLDLFRNFTDIGDQFMDALQFNTDLTPLDTSLSIGDLIKEEIVDLGIGGLTLFNYSDGLIKEFENQGYTENTDLFFFPYDWRYGVSGNNINQLQQKIEDIRTQTGSDEVDIVAHSTGGLLVKKYVMDNPENNHVDKAVFVGVPNTGAPKAIKVLLQGDGFSIPWLADAEMKKIAKNLPVVYDLSPSQQYFNTKGSYVKIVNQNLFSSSSQDLDFNQTNSFLTNDHSLNNQALTNAHNLHSTDFDNFDLRTADVDLYSINGCKAGTISKVIERRTQKIFGTDITYDSPERSPGDGTVPLESATNLPINPVNKYYALQSDHGKMLSQDNIRQQIVNIVSGGTLSVDDTKVTQDISKCKLNGKAISVFSPLDIDITDQDGNHLGLVSGAIENNIPNASFDIMGEHKFVYLPDDEGQTYDIKVVGTGNGTFTLKNDQISDNQIIQTEVFSDIPVTINLEGNLNLVESSTLSIDQNGDGNTDETILPDNAQPSLNELIAQIKAKISTLAVKDKLKQSLLKRVASLEKRIENKKQKNVKILTSLKNKISKQEIKGKIDTANAIEITNLLDLLEAQSDNIALDPTILSSLKTKIQSLNIKNNLKNDLLRRVNNLEKKYAVVKTLSNLSKNITSKATKGKISDTDAQALIDLLTQIEGVI